MPTDPDKNCNFRGRLDNIFKCVATRALVVNAKLSGYEVEIWYPLCNKSVYGSFGNHVVYGDEKYVAREWDSPQYDQRLEEDRGDEKFLPEKLKIDRKEMLPDWKGNAIISGLETRGGYGRYFGGRGDPYLDSEIVMTVPEDVTDLPEESRVRIKITGKQVLHFLSRPVRVANGIFSPHIRRAYLIPTENFL